ncbi:MAG: tripartite tricarboxylate transporter permease [Syntrophaceae bacterium]|nr:tripartite tricarboxylate transporter permease [Syntrophaceae bacterium]
MDVLQNLLYGFSIALTPMNLLFCAVGCLIGTLVGVLPGFGPIAALSLLLPLTYGLDVTGALIMLAGIFYGAQYGGSTTSILVNIPGETSAVMTCLDGHQMAKQGRAGAALGIAAFGSLIAGTAAVIGLMFLAPTLAEAALAFGPSEYASLMLMSLSLVIFLSRGSLIKGIMTAFLGLILGTVGLDRLTGELRFVYGTVVLRDGLGIVPVMIGLFGVAEVLSNVGTVEKQMVIKTKLRNLLPTLQDWRDSAFPIIRGTLLGFFMGILPGVGTSIPTFVCYGMEKKLSKHPERFGTGTIEGVAGPESCNNSTAMANFIPMLSLGIPTTATMAMLLGALILHGIQPGPLLIVNRPDLFWGLVASMYVGNIILVIMNLPLIPLWVQVLRIRYEYLFPMILLFCLVGSYSINNLREEVLIMVIFGGIGYLFKYFDYEAPPLILAFVLGPMIEERGRQALALAQGNIAEVVTRPITAVFLMITAVILAWGLKGSLFVSKVKEQQEE